MSGVSAAGPPILYRRPFMHGNAGEHGLGTHVPRESLGKALVISTTCDKATGKRKEERKRRQETESHAEIGSRQWHFVNRTRIIRSVYRGVNELPKAPRDIPVTRSAQTPPEYTSKVPLESCSSCPS